MGKWYAMSVGGALGGVGLGRATNMNIRARHFGLRRNLFEGVGGVICCAQWGSMGGVGHSVL